MNISDLTKESITEQLLDMINLDDIETNLDNFDLEIEYEVKINVKEIKLSKKEVVS